MLSTLDHFGEDEGFIEDCTTPHTMEQAPTATEFASTKTTNQKAKINFSENSSEPALLNESEINDIDATYQAVMERHEVLVEVLNHSVDPELLDEHQLFQSTNRRLRSKDNLRIRRLEIELMHAISHGNAKSTFELSQTIYPLLMSGDSEIEVISRVRHFCLQSVAFFTKALLDLGVSIELALFLLEYFSDQIESLQSCETILAYQDKILEVYIQQVKSFREHNYSPVIQAAIRYIRHHTKDRLTLGEIAKHAGVHPNYLSQKFSKEVGMTISQFIDHERLAAIKNYLLVSELSMGEIAALFNFSSVSYFSTYFKKHLGMSPSAYRQAYAND